MNQWLESWLRKKLGPVQWAAWSYQWVQRARLKWVRIKETSPHDNIYYCCTQKTASQWLRSVLSDPIIFKYTGLRVLPYQQLGLKYAAFQEPFPAKTIIAHLYVSYPAYLTIKKPRHHRTFFILRDPRDIVTSWYFSAQYSHVPVPPVPKLRKDLKTMDRHEGLKYIIDTLDDWGSFDAQRSWVHAEKENKGIKIFRYEDLANDYPSFLDRLFAYLEIHIPDNKFSVLCGRHTFKKYSGWRDPGDEDIYSHYRKGVSGDWKKYFDTELSDYFRLKTGDLLEVLGYEAS